MTIDEIEKINTSDCPSFATFAKDQLPMPGVKKRIDEVINKKLLIVDFKIRKSKRREGTECLQLQFVLNGEVCVLFTGSSVLIDQVSVAAEKNQGQFYATIIKIDKYYSFS